VTETRKVLGPHRANSTSLARVAVFVRDPHIVNFENFYGYHEFHPTFFVAMASSIGLFRGDEIVDRTSLV
jgi:hypothetical protein